MILLDTNVVSELMKGQPDPPVRDWLDRRTADGLFVSAITQAEIGLGIALLPDGKRKEALTLAAAAMFTEEFAEANLPFDQGAAAHYAALVAYRTRIGRPISTEDAQNRRDRPGPRHGFGDSEPPGLRRNRGDHTVLAVGDGMKKRIGRKLARNGIRGMGVALDSPYSLRVMRATDLWRLVAWMGHRQSCRRGSPPS